MKGPSVLGSFLKSNVGGLVALLVSGVAVAITIILGASAATRPAVRATFWLSAVTGAIVLIWLVASVIAAYRRARERHIPVCVLAGKGADELRAMWAMALDSMQNRRIDVDAHLRETGLTPLDLIVHERRPLGDDKARWHDMVSEFKNCVTRVHSQLGGRCVLHIFLYGPNALALGLGASLGVLKNVVVYEYSPGTETGARYVPALSMRGPLGTRALEKDADEPERLVKVTKAPCDDSPDLCVSVKTTPDDAPGRADAQAAALTARGGRSCCLHLEWVKSPQLGGADALPLVTATLTFIRKYTAKRQRVHLFLGTHMAESFGLGMGLGHHSPITVYQKMQGTLEVLPVMELQQLA
jgi:hypothetical protein